MPKRTSNDDYENLHMIKFIYYNFDDKNSKGQLTVRYVPLTIATKTRIQNLGNSLITEGKINS